MELTKQLLEKVARLPYGQRRAALRTIGEMEWQKCAKDPLYWVDASKHDGIPYVYTLDNHPMYLCRDCGDNGATHKFSELVRHLEMAHGITVESENETRKYFTELPTTRPFTVMPYMPPIIEVWRQKPLIAIEKSRDMMATWLVVMLYTWDTIFHEGRQNIFQSEDAKKSSELVERASFIYEHQPNFLKKWTKNQAYYTLSSTRSGMFRIEPLKSEILGFPQGPDQVRQFHPSGIFLDEAAYQEEAGAAFAAVKPAIQNGGRCTLVSSANPSYFMHVCRDTLDQLMEG